MSRSLLVIASVICILVPVVYWAGSGRGLDVERKHQILQTTNTLQSIILPPGNPSREKSRTPPHGSPVAGRVSSPFGMRLHPRYNRLKPHRGVDIAAPIGSHVMVTADGWVHRIGHHPEGHGIFVEVSHPGSGYLTLYAHLSLVHVRVGQAVKRGHVIALTGETGNAVGPHLHYEVRTSRGKHVNPQRLRPAN
ncbi:MAG: M23 family metallopeptidase [Rhodothermaceae bacterium]|nr:M23 family metallopeptidase [Rhodothermaceae bacterium]MXX58986.1 M23 family metallopeptidase [Rhodothermaceae bacterium]MYD20380.1 M23 family metallopeptidase [Rhodothermaceae bacterium]MYD55796.1 M23 family metallopeptidase [Rhodothermaceae bacterium]MYI43983.1 M23 family metallopeptidase [Rhodothermaceae bacterium]